MLLGGCRRCGAWWLLCVRLVAVAVFVPSLWFVGAGPFLCWFGVGSVPELMPLPGVGMWLMLVA